VTKSPHKRDMAASVRQRLLDQPRTSSHDFQRLLSAMASSGCSIAYSEPTRAIASS
jgi:hypothetical protein